MKSRSFQNSDPAAATAAHLFAIARLAGHQKESVAPNGRLLPACLWSRATRLPVNAACKTIEQAAAGLLAAGVALSLSLGAPAPAMARTPVSLEQKNQEREAAVQAQLSKLEYAFEQQQTAARAEIVGK